MPRIKKIHAREILDSRGNPTVEAEITTEDGVFRAAVPSGASTGKHEVLELRDGGQRFLGKGVQKAVSNINSIISRKLIGAEVNQREIDEKMIKLDGTPNKSELGANAILAVSMAAARAGAQEQLYEYIGKLSGNKNFVMPVPFMNVINGGAHAGNALDIQEFMIAPVGARDFKEAVRMCAEVYQTLKGIIKEKHGKDAINVGDEGGFAPPIDSTEGALGLLLDAIEKLGYSNDIRIALDSAASGFFSDGYQLGDDKLSSEQMVEFYTILAENYPIISFEDPFAEDDWNGFKLFTEKMGSKVQIVGDDLLVTNPEIIEKAIKEKSCNALLLKVNQIGTITEAIEAAKLAMSNKWNVMVSHRSGETEDSFIADLVVGLGCGQIKSGAPCRSERTSKYNQLLRLEEQKLKYAKVID